jgi:hypothetical protein
MKNIQIIDRARNATFSIFQATEDEYHALFPDGRDMEVIEAVIERFGEAETGQILSPLWSRPILKSEAQGIHGTLFYDYGDDRDIFPDTMREVDWNEGAINQAQRELFQTKR